jgi:hypothetical protein
MSRRQVGSVAYGRGEIHTNFPPPPQKNLKVRDHIEHSQCRWEYNHHHHHLLLSLMGHRTSTKRRHQVLSLAILFTSLQLFPFSNASLWTDLRHVWLGIPLLQSSSF